MPLLDIVDLTKRFMGTCALDNISFHIEEGELVGLVGPNGSGKTTFFNCLTGLLRPDAGRIMYRGANVTARAPHRIALRGISRTFQHTHVFGQLTVMDNLLASKQQHEEDSLVRRFLRTPAIRRFEEHDRVGARALLDMVGLTRFADTPAAHLSYGQQKLLGFAMALMPDPTLLCLDEPAAAVNPTLIDSMMTHIRDVHKTGKTVLIVEHNMEVIMRLCTRVIVLNYGKILADDVPGAVQRDDAVIQAYLGA